jgi:hypothetical protein
MRSVPPAVRNTARKYAQSRRLATPKPQAATVFRQQKHSSDQSKFANGNAKDSWQEALSLTKSFSLNSPGCGPPNPAPSSTFVLQSDPGELVDSTLFC